MTDKQIKLCPCGSGLNYSECCQPFHLYDRWPSTVEQLMRSRFSAFALGLEEYLQATWAKSTRLGSLDLDENLLWTRLEIISTEQGMPFDQVGKVHFKAYYQLKEGGKVLDSGVMEEVSLFERDESQHWVYVTGEVKS